MDSYWQIAKKLQIDGYVLFPVIQLASKSYSSNGEIWKPVGMIGRQACQSAASRSECSFSIVDGEMNGNVACFLKFFEFFT